MTRKGSEHITTLNSGIMGQTVIGIFETSLEAQKAVEGLIARNFNRENINVSTPNEHRGRGDITDENNILGSKTATYFRNIFDSEDDVLRYTAVAQQGVMVAVQTEIYENAVRAAEILNSFGAIDVNERSRLLEDSFTREDRTGGYDKNQNIQVKTFSGIAEHEKPSGTMVEKPSASDMERGGVRMHSRIVERTIPGVDTTHEEERWVEPGKPNQK
jgi:hypothetical protein